MRTARYTNTIPEADSEWVAYWQAPHRNEIEFRGDAAVMDKAAFDKLLNYSSSLPTGVWIGKLWKARLDDGRWYLRWYSTDPRNAANCLINSRPITIRWQAP